MVADIKLVTDYEVEGCWGTVGPNSKCRRCQTPLVECPREGHYNSQYWRLERNDGCVLKICPNGCRERTALATFYCGQAYADNEMHHDDAERAAVLRMAAAEDESLDYVEKLNFRQAAERLQERADRRIIKNPKELSNFIRNQIAHNVNLLHEARRRDTLTEFGMVWGEVVDALGDIADNLEGADYIEDFDDGIESIHGLIDRFDGMRVSLPIIEVPVESKHAGPTKIEITENYYGKWGGWVLPNGDFLPTLEFAHHAATCFEARLQGILTDLDDPKREADPYRLEHMDWQRIAEKQGWIKVARVTLLNGRYTAACAVRRITKAQMNTLLDWASTIDTENRWYAVKEMESYT